MIERRSLMAFMSAAASSRWLGACAEGRSDKGLFWRLEIPDKRTAIVFGAWTQLRWSQGSFLTDTGLATQRVIAIDRVADAKVSDCGETRLGLNPRLAEV